MTFKKLFIDFETRSTVDLKDEGAWKYATHPSTQVISAAWAMDYEEIQSASGFPLSSESVQEIAKKVAEADILVAHNAVFEYLILTLVLHIDLDKAAIHDTMAIGNYNGRPAKLEYLAEALGLQGKDTVGSSAMRRLCKPAPNGNFIENEELLKEVERYNVQDVNLTRQIYQRLGPLPRREQLLWNLDLDRVHCRGLQVDLPFIHQVLDSLQAENEPLLKEAMLLTGGISPLQVGATVGWLNQWPELQWVDNLQKATLDTILDSPVPSVVKRVLEIRQALSKTSNAKYGRALEMADDTGVVRGYLHYHGATPTGRWAGRGIQPQNLPRPQKPTNESVPLFQQLGWKAAGYPSAMAAASDMLRGIIIPRQGKVLGIADYNAIEPRVLAWLAGEHTLLDMFANKKDPYIWMASVILNKPITQITKAERQTPGKITVLGCGYQMGPAKFAAQNKVDLPFAEQCVNVYRQTFGAIKRLWWDVNSAAMNAVQYPGHQVKVAKVVFALEQGDLLCRLPSGRVMTYPTATLTENRFGSLGLSYYGVANTGKQRVEETYGGKLVENIVQAIARDVMVDALIRLIPTPTHVLFHSHDELVVEGPPGISTTLVNAMRQAPDWAPDLPLEIEAGEYNRYDK